MDGQLIEASVRLLGSVVALATGLFGLSGAIAALSARRRREKREAWLNTMAERKSLPAGVAATFVIERNRTAAQLAAALWVPIRPWAIPSSIAGVMLMFLSGHIFTGFSFRDYVTLFNLESATPMTADELKAIAWPLSVIPALPGLFLCSGQLKHSVRALARREYLIPFLLRRDTQSLPKPDAIPTKLRTNWLTAGIVLAAWSSGGLFGLESETSEWAFYYVSGLMCVALGILVVSVDDL